MIVEGFIFSLGITSQDLNSIILLLSVLKCSVFDLFIIQQSFFAEKTCSYIS
jgi:hypothetical protein